MEEYQKNLFHMKGGERYAESFLIKLSSEETVKDAVLQGMIREAGKTEYDISLYVITERGIKCKK